MTSPGEKTQVAASLSPATVSVKKEGLSAKLQCNLKRHATRFFISNLKNLAEVIETFGRQRKNHN